MRIAFSRELILSTLLLSLAVLTCHAAGQAVRTNPAKPELVIIDTDIGDDIDDAMAVGLALSSPELKILGITAAWGDTALRARLLDRLLSDAGRGDIPVAAGIEKTKAGAGAFTQAKWAEREPTKAHPGAVDFILNQIKAHPGEVTLIGIAPLTNVAAALESDPATFKKLKRIVLMGGSIHRGYDDLGYGPSHGPDAEYNIAMDVPAAQAVFGSGVPIYLMPLDSTQLKLDEVKRRLLFTGSTPLTDDLTLLYQLWSRGTSQQTPTMFDAVAVVYAIDAAQCPATPMRVGIDAKGFTCEEPGQANVSVCLRSDSDAFFDFYLPRLMTQRLGALSTLRAK